MFCKCDNTFLNFSYNTCNKTCRKDCTGDDIQMRIMITSEALPVLLALLSSHKDSILMKRVRQFQIQTVINANIVPPLNIASLSCSPIIRILSYPSISFQMFLIFINIQIVCPPSNTSSHCLQINGKFFGFSCDIPLLCPIHPSSL